MTEILKEFNFNNLIEEYGHIRVPEIQRDYAEGRKIQKVIDIRKSFLSVLMQVVAGAKECEHLDFVYGNIQDNAFEPLDGQQRLTTLFLLSWFFAPNGCRDLMDENEQSVFTYETRTTAKEFCNELVMHSASDLYAKLQEMTEGTKFSNLMMSKSWFKWSWHYDPTVSSMLTVLDSIVEILQEKNSGYLYSTDYYKNINNIKFHRLRLADLELSDGLYVKMNARGKALSEFDILKSTLEEEIQLQKQEGLADNDLESAWRSCVDGLWIDFCWDKYTRGCSVLSKSQVEEVEVKYRQLLIRLIALQLCRNLDMQDVELWTASCNTYQRELDKVIPKYVEDLFNFRHRKKLEIEQPESERINFQGILDDFNSILYKDNSGKNHDITDLLNFGIEPDKSKSGLMDLYLEPSFSRSTQVIFYAALAFARLISAQNIYNDASRQQDFNDWIRFVRNTVLISNNNARIDKPEKSIEAMGKVDELLSDFFNSKKSMLDFLEDVKDGNQFAKERVEEEQIKAALRHDKKWDELILRAEKHPMLWGQICSLLDWSKLDSPNYDIEKFELYLNYLEKILTETAEMENINLFYRGLLCVRDYRFDNCLLRYSRERDRSWKRYLREYNNTYAPILKEVIDIWDQEIPNVKTFAECLDHLYKSRHHKIKDWRRFVIEQPNMLWYAYDKMIFHNDGHYYLAQLKTMDSHCREILLEYVYSSILAPQMTENMHLAFHDTKDNIDKNSVTWDNYKIQILEKGNYCISCGDAIICNTNNYDTVLSAVNRIVQFNI